MKLYTWNEYTQVQFYVHMKFLWKTTFSLSFFLCKGHMLFFFTHVWLIATLLNQHTVSHCIFATAIKLVWNVWLERGRVSNHSFLTASVICGLMKPFSTVIVSLKSVWALSGFLQVPHVDIYQFHNMIININDLFGYFNRNHP